MRFARVIVKNWRNFRKADVAMETRLFVVGANASGKSNLLDVFRFCRDIAKKGGGLQETIAQRGGLSKLRCLAARFNSKVEIDVYLTDDEGTRWHYAISLTQEQRGKRQPVLAYEKVWKNDEKILNRPDEKDKSDPQRLTQTQLEQIAGNFEFRGIAEAFQKIVYLHLVPQLLKHPQLANRDAVGEDPVGVKFLERIMESPEKTRKSRLTRIEKVLQVAVPELSQLHETRDSRGVPHLEAVYKHWRPNGAMQQEDQFSDGTIRLLGLMWILLDGDGLVLLEEPELSLHDAIVSKLPALMWRLQQTRKKAPRQVFLSTHSVGLLGDKGISPEEVVLLRSRGGEGTEVVPATSIEVVKRALDGGMTIGEAILPHTAPPQIAQLTQLTLF
jgi:predicted ATPase